MKKFIDILIVFTIFMAVASCHKVERTYDTVIYDESQVPIIIAKSEPRALYAGQEYNWDVRIEAFNGIKDVKINGEVILSYNNGQFIHDGTIPIVMPATDNYRVLLVVTDELDNATSYPEFTIALLDEATSTRLVMSEGDGTIVFFGDSVSECY